MAERPRVAVIAQARMGSSRLPGKVLRRTGGDTLLGHLARRVAKARLPDCLVIATTTSRADAEIIEEARRLGVEAFRGSEEDVLARYQGAAAMVEAEVIVRVTGDCPLLDPDELDRVIEAYLSRLGTDDERDFVRNQAGLERIIPFGHDVEVFSRALLDEAAERAAGPGEREHVTPWFYNTPGRYRTLRTDPPGPDLSHLRLTVDTPDDLTLVSAIFEALGPGADAPAIDAFLTANPKIAALNKNIKQRGTDSERDRRKARIAGKTLLARADAGRHIGFGHVARLESLLDAWSELGGRALLYGSGIGGSIRDRLEAAGVEIIDRHTGPERATTPEDVQRAGAEDLHQTLALAREHEAVAIATDGYGFKADYRAGLAAELPLLALDDLADFRCVADVVLNQNMGFPAERYEVAPHTRLLVGHEYALFRREFRKVTEALASGPEPTPSGHRILLTFGGSDPAGLTFPVASALLPSLGPGDEITAIAGGGMKPTDRAGLDALAADASGATLTILTDVRHMAEVIEGATLAITAAGSTTWELIVCGVPPLAVPVADNQRAVATGVAERGAGIDLGWHADLTPEAIRDRALALLDNAPARQQLIDRGRALIDGKGVWRAIDALLTAIERRSP